MRGRVHKIMSPNKEVIPYKDWTTTGQYLRIKSLWIYLFVLASLSMWHLHPSPEEFFCCFITVREARARQSPTDMQEKLRNYFEKTVKRPQNSNMLRWKEMFLFLLCVTISLIIVLGPGRSLDGFRSHSSAVHKVHFPRISESANFALLFLCYNHYSFDI